MAVIPAPLTPGGRAIAEIVFWWALGTVGGVIAGSTVVAVGSILLDRVMEGI